MNKIQISEVEIWIKDKIRKYRDKNVLLVTHGGVSKAISCYFNGVPDDGNLQVLGLKNCEVREYDL